MNIIIIYGIYNIYGIYKSQGVEPPLARMRQEPSQLRRSADLDSHKNLLFHTVHQLCESACKAYALKLLERMLGLQCVAVCSGERLDPPDLAVGSAPAGR